MTVTVVRDEDLLDEPAVARRGGEPSLTVRRRVAGLAVAGAGLALATLALTALDDRLTLEGVSLVYLLVVVVVALLGGWVAALPAAFAAALLINYEFVTPVHSLDIRRGDQGIALLIFLAVAGAVSALVETVVRRARTAERAVARADALSALAGPDLRGDETLRDVLERARRTFGMETVALHRREVGGAWVEAEAAGRSAGAATAPLRFDVALGDDLRLLGRGPAHFASDHALLEAFGGAARTAYEGRRLSHRAREASALAAADEQRVALLAAVGHDLRTPLATIKASAGTLRQTDVAWTPADREELLATIEDSADRLEHVVANLLDASRLQAGALAVRPVAVDLEEVVGAAVAAIPGAAERVRVELPDGLRAVHADPGLLERVLVNLIDNALRHGGPPPVTVSATAGEWAAKVAVADTGPGVPEPLRDGMFAPFQRTGDASTGLGLGLSVARGFMEAMDGGLVADHSDRGLTLRLRIPYAP